MLPQNVSSKRHVMASTAGSYIPIKSTARGLLLLFHFTPQQQDIRRNKTDGKGGQKTEGKKAKLDACGDSNIEEE